LAPTTCRRCTKGELQGSPESSDGWGAGYGVYDPVGQKFSRADKVFVNLDGEPMYIRVHIGFLFTSTVLIPVQFVETDDENKALILK
jgi:hypothetical protein